MEFVVLTFPLIVVSFFIVSTARQALRETRYYEYLAEEDAFYYESVIEGNKKDSQ